MSCPRVYVQERTAVSIPSASARVEHVDDNAADSTHTSTSCKASGSSVRLSRRPTLSLQALDACRSSLLYDRELSSCLLDSWLPGRSPDALHSTSAAANADPETADTALCGVACREFWREFWCELAFRVPE